MELTFPPTVSNNLRNTLNRLRELIYSGVFQPFSHYVSVLYEGTLSYLSFSQEKEGYDQARLSERFQQLRSASVRYFPSWVGSSHSTSAQHPLMTPFFDPEDRVSDEPDS